MEIVELVCHRGTLGYALCIVVVIIVLMDTNVTYCSHFAVHVVITWVCLV